MTVEQKQPTKPMTISETIAELTKVLEVGKQVTAKTFEILCEIGPLHSRLTEKQVRISSK